MNDRERSKAFNKALREQVKTRRLLLSEAWNQISVILELTEEQINQQLAAMPTEWQLYRTRTLQGEIDRILVAMGERTSEQIKIFSDKAIQQGMDVLDIPLQAAGINLSSVAPQLSIEQLENMRHFAGERLKDVSKEVGVKINKKLGLVVTGAITPFEAKKAVNKLMQGEPVWRGKTVVNTELSSLFSRSTNERMISATKYLPGLKKKWLKSRRKDPRETHHAAHQQIVDIDKPFLIGVVKMMHPHDPKAPAKEVVNCGCMKVPHMSNWQVNEPLQKSE